MRDQLPAPTSLRICAILGWGILLGIAAAALLAPGWGNFFGH